MSIQIRQLAPADVEAVVELSRRAWIPVFESLEATLGPVLFRHLYPDWEAMQAESVRDSCADDTSTKWVAVTDGAPVGFTGIVFHDDNDVEPNSGEIDMLVVDPDFQHRGISASLMAVALEAIRHAGAQIAVIGTGGDPGHAAARAAYEKAGFIAFPQVRYYLPLQSPEHGSGSVD